MSSIILKIAVRIPIFLICVLSGTFLHVHFGWTPIICILVGFGIFFVLNFFLILSKIFRIVLCIFSAGCIGIMMSSAFSSFILSKITLPEARWTVYIPDAIFFVVAAGLTVGFSFLFHYFVDLEYGY